MRLEDIILVQWACYILARWSAAAACIVIAYIMHRRRSSGHLGSVSILIEMFLFSIALHHIVYPFVRYFEIWWVGISVDALSAGIGIVAAWEYARVKWAEL